MRVSAGGICKCDRNPAPLFADFLRKLCVKFDSFLTFTNPSPISLMMLQCARHLVSLRRASGGVMMKSQEYRSKALECLESAPWICDRSAKKALINMALCWLRLADMHDDSESRSQAAHRISNKFS
jgi:hypothetical protein